MMSNIRVTAKLAPDYRGEDKPHVMLQAPSRFYRLTVTDARELLRELEAALQAAEGMTDGET